MKKILLGSISFMLTFFISLSGICAAGFLEHSHAAENHSEAEHCTDENEVGDTVVSQAISPFQSQIAGTPEAVFRPLVASGSYSYDPLSQTHRRSPAGHTLQEHIRSVVLRI